MRILLTNDDGIRAPGIVALYDALQGIGDPTLEHLADELVTIAPATVQSATSHGVTFDAPLIASETQVNDRMTGVAVDGRPADCVKLALANLWPERFGAGSRPDLVISGMNAGANIGINVIYSGTVAAAIEAAFLGIPSIAVSLHLGRGRTDFAGAARRARRVIDAILETELLKAHSCLSVNIPITEAGAPGAGKLPEIVVCPMNTHGLHDRYERRESPRGDVYYWSSSTGFDFQDTDVGSDVHALIQGKITITPLGYDLTASEALDGWRKALV